MCDGAGWGCLPRSSRGDGAPGPLRRSTQHPVPRGTPQTPPGHSRTGDVCEVRAQLRTRWELQRGNLGGKPPARLARIFLNAVYLKCPVEMLPALPGSHTTLPPSLRELRCLFKCPENFIWKSAPFSFPCPPCHFLFLPFITLKNEPLALPCRVPSSSSPRCPRPLRLTSPTARAPGAHGAPVGSHGQVPGDTVPWGAPGTPLPPRQKAGAGWWLWGFPHSGCAPAPLCPLTWLRPLPVRQELPEEKKNQLTTSKPRNNHLSTSQPHLGNIKTHARFSLTCKRTCCLRFHD